MSDDSKLADACARVEAQARHVTSAREPPTQPASQPMSSLAGVWRSFEFEELLIVIMNAASAGIA